MATSEVIAAPLRTCVGCRQRRPQTEMVRCVLSAKGAIVSRVAAGRGAWLCSAGCLDTARRKRAFERAWRASVPEEVVQLLDPEVRMALVRMELGTAIMEESRNTKG